MTFRVGQRVVCVNTEGTAGIVRYEVYTVAAIVAAWTNKEEAVELEEVKSVETYAGRPHWYSWRFRLIAEKKTDISIFTDLLIPTKEFVNG